MKRLLSLMLIISFTAGVTGCVRYYRTKEVNRNLNRVISDSDKITSRMNKDYSKKKMIYYRITGLIPDKAVKPYPELARELIGMEKALNETKKINSEQKEKIRKFRSSWKSGCPSRMIVGRNAPSREEERVPVFMEKRKKD